MPVLAALMYRRLRSAISFGTESRTPLPFTYMTHAESRSALYMMSVMRDFVQLVVGSATFGNLCIHISMEGSQMVCISFNDFTAGEKSPLV
jgi:hypothetical protein